MTNFDRAANAEERAALRDLGAPVEAKGDVGVQAHFVEFFSPGTFVSEERRLPIAAWDVEEAKRLALGVHERHAARPYGFRFITKSRGPADLDSRITATSHFYYLGGTIRTREEVEADNLPEESILRSNMRINDIERIVTNNNSWRFTAALNEGDVILDFAFPAIAAAEGRQA